MRLRRYALGTCWTVYLYCQDDETCPILEIYEFRLPTSKGPTPRVSYFFDSGRVIVCALALLKKSNRLPRHFVDQSIEIRRVYFATGGVRAAVVEIHDDRDEEEL